MKKLTLKPIWHRQKKMPSLVKIQELYGKEGRFVALSHAIFGGYHIWLLVKPKLTLQPPHHG
jgi:hypothetical protein